MTPEGVGGFRIVFADCRLVAGPSKDAEPIFPFDGRCFYEHRSVLRAASDWGHCGLHPANVSRSKRPTLPDTDQKHYLMCSSSAAQLSKPGRSASRLLKLTLILDHCGRICFGVPLGQRWKLYVIMICMCSAPHLQLIRCGLFMPSALAVEGCFAYS